MMRHVKRRILERPRRKNGARMAINTLFEPARNRRGFIAGTIPKRSGRSDSSDSGSELCKASVADF